MCYKRSKLSAGQLIPISHLQHICVSLLVSNIVYMNLTYNNNIQIELREVGWVGGGARNKSLWLL
jgi:hypothetical protein